MQLLANVSIRVSEVYVRSVVLRSFCTRFAYEFAEPSFANYCTSIFVALSGRLI